MGKRFVRMGKPKRRARYQKVVGAVAVDGKTRGKDDDMFFRVSASNIFIIETSFGATERMWPTQNHCNT